MNSVKGVKGVAGVKGVRGIGIYDTTEVRVTDGEMEIFLHNLARKENNDFIRKIADRFAMLASTAHNRKHWTGHE
jgi:hypothetical protein|tara:strand:- start:877 stop:1101 length:225 start_codon:yes stop_codon:yes gene_type:complete